MLTASMANADEPVVVEVPLTMNYVAIHSTPHRPMTVSLAWLASLK